MTSDFDEIAAGLQEAITHARGEQTGAVEHRIEVPPLDVAALRGKLEMSQERFAQTFGISLSTVQNWEQGRRVPRGPARVLLQIIAHEPEAVRRALAHIAA